MGWRQPDKRRFPFKLLLMLLGAAQWTLKTHHIPLKDPHRLCTMSLDGQKKIWDLKYFPVFVNLGQLESYSTLIFSLHVMTSCLVSVSASGISGFRVPPNHIMLPQVMLGRKGLPGKAVCMMLPVQGWCLWNGKCFMTVVPCLALTWRCLIPTSHQSFQHAIHRSLSWSCSLASNLWLTSKHPPFSPSCHSLFCN